MANDSVLVPNASRSMDSDQDLSGTNGDTDLHQYRYTRLVNGSPSVSSSSPDLIESKENFCSIPLTDNDNDQKLPTTEHTSLQSQQFYYMNKNSDFVKITSNRDPKLSPSLSSSTTTGMLQTHEYGQLQVNTSLTLQVENDDVPHDHVKYAHLVTILFFWCFPCTGIPALIYAHLMKKSYQLKDMVKVREYLKKTENLILFSFFFGLTIIAIVFAIFQATYPSPVQLRANEVINGSSIYNFVVRH
jgi:hypothetical protein